ncbi:MAG TPA: hypothetical protein DET40_05565 [Lentisphaeria bacterium]|nr:MAG: hypothetical protein A2X45_12305 [Lentisphaerae bacterium GWF2_50_93]HCE42994.1 hypothetical protein [Lentisphaeria bacterium]
MISLWAIIKLTCRAAMRSHIFHLLLFVLLLTIAILPNTVLGDGTASGYIQVSLKYCLGAIGFILSLSTIWVSCFILSNDLESYQIHMVFTKPVSRMKVWIGKWLGVVLIHGILLLVASGIVYGLILWQFYRKPFTAEEKARINNEVLVGRRVFLPDMPDVDAKVKDEYRKRVDYLKSAQAENFQNLSNAEKKKMLRELRKQIIAQLGEVKPGQTSSRYWDYKGVPKDLKSPLYFRYRIYVGKISSKDQRETEGLWSIRILVPENDIKDRKPGEEVKMREVFIPKSQYPEREMCGVFHEMALMPAVVDKDGTVTIAFTNFDREQKPVYFQGADGPKLLISAGSFWDNYLRAVFVIFLRILFLAGLACTAGGLLSMPTAVFVVLSYLLIGICASYIINIETEFGEDDELTQYEAWHETAARVLSHTILWGIIPMQKFEVSDSVANGELIEYSMIARTVFDFFILRGVPIFLLGILLYRRRELGTIIRK